MQRIIVDLPEPDGPQITMRSPRITRRSMSRSTWNSPYHLSTLTSSTAGMPVVVASASLIARSSSLASLRQPRFHRARVTRHAVAEDQIDDRRDGITRGRGRRRRPFRIDARDLDRMQEIEDANDVDERR